MNKILELILREQCNRVGATFEDIDFKKNDWYQQHTWTEKEQDDYEQWLIEYLYTNNRARKELNNDLPKNKKILTKGVTWHIGNYGWNLNYENK